MKNQFQSNFPNFSIEIIFYGKARHSTEYARTNIIMESYDSIIVNQFSSCALRKSLLHRLIVLLENLPEIPRNSLEELSNFLSTAFFFVGWVNFFFIYNSNSPWHIILEYYKNVRYTFSLTKGEQLLFRTYGASLFIRSKLLCTYTIRDFKV